MPPPPQRPNQSNENYRKMLEKGKWRRSPSQNRNGNVASGSGTHRRSPSQNRNGNNAFKKFALSVMHKEMLKKGNNLETAMRLGMALGVKPQRTNYAALYRRRINEKNARRAALLARNPGNLTPAERQWLNNNPPAHLIQKEYRGYKSLGGLVKHFKNLFEHQSHGGQHAIFTPTPIGPNELQRLRQLQEYRNRYTPRFFGLAPAPGYPGASAMMQRISYDARPYIRRLARRYGRIWLRKTREKRNKKSPSPRRSPRRN